MTAKQWERVFSRAKDPVLRKIEIKRLSGLAILFTLFAIIYLVLLIVSDRVGSSWGSLLFAIIIGIYLDLHLGMLVLYERIMEDIKGMGKS